MANAPSRFEQMVLNNGPVQTSIIQNLTRWEFLNLQLAGLRIPVGREFKRKMQIPTGCSEVNPRNRDEMCAHTTESFDEIRACAGYPFRTPNGDFVMENWMADHRTQICLLNEPWRVQERHDLAPGSRPDLEPNAEKYPIHTKICRRCHEFYAVQRLNEQLLMIADFRAPLCKQHSLELTYQFPLNACRCLAFINDKWRCRRCCVHSLNTLDIRAYVSKESLKNVRIPWSQPWAYLQSLWTPDRPLCPIKGCFQQAWFDETGESVQMCLGCNRIIQI
ncbi:hypothetical protein MMC22_002217 [Lobaria immixta]|nr:hypothetical protein [Lobaria immixta]